MLYIILSGLLLLVLVVVLIGALLPKTRTKTKQCILNAPVDVVFAIVTNNWRKRSMPTHSGRFYPPFFDARSGLKSA